MWVPNGPASTAVTSGDTPHFGGGFDCVGPALSDFAAIDASGEALPGTPNIEGRVQAIAPDGWGGWFGSVGGQSRSNIAQVDSSLGLPTAWNPGTNDGVEALLVRGDTRYVGGEFFVAGGAARDAIAGLGAITDAPRPGTRNPTSPSHRSR